MVEARVDEVQRDNLDVPGAGKKMVALVGSTWAVAGPQTRAIRGEERIALSFKRYLAGNIEDGVASGVEPAAEVLLFSLALGVEEAAENDDAIVLKTSVGG